MNPTTGAARKVACFSWHYPPAQNAEALVTAKWTRALEKRGHEVTAFPFAGAPGGLSGRLARAIRELLRHSVHAFKRDLLELPFPGPLNEYVVASLAKFAALNAQAPFDVIVSRYEPVGSAIAGLCARNLTGLPWILCINDPMPRLIAPRSGHMGLLDRERNRFQRRWAVRLIGEPDRLVFPSARLRDYTLAVNGTAEAAMRLEKRCSVVPHAGGSEAPETGGSDSAPVPPPRPVIRHIGYLSRVRTVDTLLEGLVLYAGMPGAVPFDVEFVGDSSGQVEKIRALAERRLSGIGIAVLPAVDPVTAFERMRSATLLALVEEPGEKSVFLPSKFCDYAAAGRPVLALAPQEGAIADYLDQFGGGLCISHGDSAGTARAIDLAFSGRLTGSAELAAQFTPSRVAESWERIIESAIEERNRPR